MYGTWDPTAAYDAGAFADYAAAHPISLVNQLGFWVAPDRGIFVWTPATLLLLPALVRSWRRLPDWSTSLVWGGLAYTVMQGVLNRFWGGDVFYGYRLGLEMLACAAPALALSAGAHGSGRAHPLRTGRRRRDVRHGVRRASTTMRGSLAARSGTTMPSS